MVAVDDRVFGELTRVAKNRNITVQELLRAIAVPEWMRLETGTRIGFGDYPTRELSASRV